jgi:HlyD family secretion protein
MNRSTFVVGLVLLSGCSAASAAHEDPLQGIVEHDERVLGFTVGGRVLEVSATPGAAVVAGQMLVRLDDSLERPVRDARLAEIDAARAQLSLVQAGPRAEEIRAADAELRAVREQEGLLEGRRTRQTALIASGALATATLDELDSTLSSLVGRREVIEERIRGLRRGARSEEVDAAEARLHVAQAGLATADTRLSHHVLSSPGNFVVTDVHASAGEIAGPGTAAVTVADLDHPFVDVFVPEGRITSVSVGQRANVRVDGINGTLVGVVEHVSNRTEFTPRFLFSESERPNLVLRVRIRIEDPRHRLRAGVPAFVTVGDTTAAVAGR